MRRMRRLFWLGILFCFSAQAQAQGPDPSGVWESEMGSLSLMLAGDKLAFSYTSVFGPAAHICEGTGIARRAADGSYVHKDAPGKTYVIAGDAVEIVSLHETLAKEWVLARYKGAKSVTLGCLRRADLDCQSR